MALKELLEQQKEVRKSLAKARELTSTPVLEDSETQSQLYSATQGLPKDSSDAIRGRQEPVYVTPTANRVLANTPEIDNPQPPRAQFDPQDSEREKTQLRLPESLARGLNRDQREALRDAVGRAIPVSVGEQVAYLAYHINASESFRSTIEARYDSLSDEKKALIDAAKTLNISPEKFKQESGFLGSIFSSIVGVPAFKGPDAAIAQVIPQDAPTSVFLQTMERQKIGELGLGPDKDYTINSFVSSDRGTAINTAQFRREVEPLYYRAYLRDNPSGTPEEAAKYAQDEARKDLIKAGMTGRNIAWAVEVNPRRVEEFSELPAPLSFWKAYLSPQRKAIDAFAPSSEELER